MLLVVLAAWHLKQAPALLSVSLKTEILSMRVARRDASRMLLPVALNVRDGRCYRDIILRPEVGSIVTYARARSKRLFVSVAGMASWDATEIHDKRKTGRRFLADASPQFMVSEKDSLSEKHKPCLMPERSHVRLPVSGVAEFGSLLYPVTDTQSDQLVLLSGRMSIFGRAISSILGWPLTRAPFQPHALYLVEEIPIPGGTRIVAADVELNTDLTPAPSGSSQDSADAHISRWQGFADMTFGGEDSGAMDVEASTVARRVQMYSPAGSYSIEAQEPDIVSLSLGAQLVGDPNLRWIAGLAAVLITLLGLSELFGKSSLEPKNQNEERMPCRTFPSQVARSSRRPWRYVPRFRSRPLRRRSGS